MMLPDGFVFPMRKGQVALGLRRGGSLGTLCSESSPPEREPERNPGEHSGKVLILQGECQTLKYLKGTYRTDKVLITAKVVQILQKRTIFCLQFFILFKFVFLISSFAVRGTLLGLSRIQTNVI